MGRVCLDQSLSQLILELSVLDLLHAPLSNVSHVSGAKACWWRNLVLEDRVNDQKVGRSETCRVLLLAWLRQTSSQHRKFLQLGHFFEVLDLNSVWNVGKLCYFSENFIEFLHWQKLLLELCLQIQVLLLWLPLCKLSQVQKIFSLQHWTLIQRQLLYNNLKDLCSHLLLHHPLGRPPLFLPVH